MDLSRFPRVRLAHCPTPLEPMARLSAALGGPRLLVKRDDCTGLATGGSKTRKLEFLIGDALRHGADTLITTGAVQSNHTRQTAAAAAKLGLKCELVLERRVETADPAYDVNGNLLLDRLLGARLHYRPDGADIEAAMQEVAQDVQRAGGVPYVIPAGGSSRVGALGYVSCAQELTRQAAEQGVSIDWLVVATGSGGTQSGLVAGLFGAASATRVCGICIRYPEAHQLERVHALASETARFAGVERPLPRDRVVANGDYVGPGYGLPTAEMVAAIELVARHEGILLDPVYTGKAMAGLIGLIRQGFFGAGETVAFLHTGGTAALFGYPTIFA